MTLKCKLWPAFALLCAAQATAADVVLVPLGATWKYLDNGSNQGSAWRAPAFNDAGWASGPAELGYGDGDEATVVSYGPSSSNKYITTYFRRTFSIANVSAFPAFLLEVLRDDGVIIWVNGVEAMRNNVAEGTIGYTAGTYASIGALDELRRYEQLLPAALFVNGSNTIAVEMHQYNGSSTDLSFDLRLTGLDNVPSLFRGPYLQAAHAGGITIKWKTDVPCNGRVRYGTAPGNTPFVVDNASVSQDHDVVITGLLPSTTYYYNIGTTTADLAGVNDASYFFRTHPVISTSTPLRIWAIGDAGTATTEQFGVRDSYLNYVGSNKADVWLMLGDNAYFHGREAEFHASVFKEGYPSILRNTCLWPTPGNHDYYSSADATTETGPYFDLFAPPKLGQCGGVPSNTEAYYSFDRGNVHFISLDSYDSPRTSTGAMATWLLQDLAYAEAHSDWVIAYWHHPPYSKGSHNSDDPADSGGIMRDMRQNILPILEAHGVDLVLTGHSHSYERSYLIDGHYGLSSTFNMSTMRLDGAAGRISELGAYQKAGDMAPHDGAVYTVCGVGGKKDAVGSLNHPAMFMSTYSQLGSLLIDIDGTALHAKFLNDAGAVIDHYDIEKPQSTLPLALKVALEGPLDTISGLMHDSLRVRGFIPLQQPFTGIFPLVGEGGSEAIAPAVLTVAGPNAIVDWVLVEVRNAEAPGQVLNTRAALLQRDGDVVDIDGVSPVRVHMAMGFYQVSVRHRNHLGAMTATPVQLMRSVSVIDFRSGSLATYGTAARRSIAGGLALWMGNSVADDLLMYVGTSNDRDPMLTAIGGVLVTNTVSGYLPEDTNMDGTVKYIGTKNDRDPILVNVGGVVPTNTRQEQLP
ncbi:MAG: metallophosphoesterase family protein [Flavobacteriales bacterium]